MPPSTLSLPPSFAPHIFHPGFLLEHPFLISLSYKEIRRSVPYPLLKQHYLVYAQPLETELK